MIYETLSDEPLTVMSSSVKVVDGTPIRVLTSTPVTHPCSGLNCNDLKLDTLIATGNTDVLESDLLRPATSPIEDARFIESSINSFTSDKE